MTKTTPLSLSLALCLAWAFSAAGAAQEPAGEILRPPPPARDDLELDANADGVPDGWYNARDAAIETTGGAAGPHFVRFACERRGRPARLSRAFGVDGRKVEAIVLGLWVRLKDIEYGERVGEEPSLLIDFLGDELRQLSRGTMGPWTRSVGDRWTRVAKRIPVPPGTHDAIMSVGLMGASGRLDVDGLTFELIPRQTVETTNLVVNGDFELGDPSPSYWTVDNDAARISPGRESDSAIELSRSGARVLTGLALPVEGFNGLELSLYARGQGLRGSGGAGAVFYYLDEQGEPLGGRRGGEPAFQWSGSFDWRAQRTVVPVPRGAVRAVVQFEKSDGVGSIRIDDVRIAAAPNPELGSWSPFQTADDVIGWHPHEPAATIAAGSALDFSFLSPSPAGSKGNVVVKDGRLAFQNGGRARFFGVQLLPPAAFQEADKADELADRLARSGVNLVRLGELDTPLGPDRSLFDDVRDDTREFDPVALERLDHLIAALEKRGIYVALELLGGRRFRSDDGVKSAGLLPPGGGPAAVLDPTIGKLNVDASLALLSHPNAETGRALRDSPGLAWVTLAGEASLFDLIDRPDSLPASYGAELRARAEKTRGLSGRRLWHSIESAHYAGWADQLRKAGLKAPVASVSHWRREPEFASSLVATGLDLIDDRLYWNPSPWLGPDFRSQLWSGDGGLVAGASRKLAEGRPYVVGQWCPQTQGAWAFPNEAADQLLASATALQEDWDALVRRGVFVHPKVWGDGPVGTAGGEDIFQLPEVANGTPQVYALWPHAASILLRGREPATGRETAPARNAPRRKALPPGWDPSQGRLVVDTPYTQGIAGWNGDAGATFPTLSVASESPFAVVVASSVGTEPIERAGRLLVTTIARVEPTGYRWVDPWKREAADPGRPPLLQEPVRARVEWRRKGTIKAFALDGAGARVKPAQVETLSDGEGVALIVDGRTPTIHWELIAE
ncbi:hypothetical protein [Planctomyces sp. SH-PL62]|uniref:hypothetical protein n=1 Tax=Planctomyces sp. SH-PL62 TaxID=1636152 RepID=UPI00078CA600|nr:hypothetical protein [Planctomyces sp. SH-PL62]AMV38844.1 hypothetical protein VT85_15525 [Planctomyces sp. SH-PL62]